jgi:alkylation response protein AidB-like acyl-CoA dehydrogenase
MSALRAEGSDGVDELEDLESFRHRARTFIRSNLRTATPEDLAWGRAGASEELELAAVARERELQRTLFDAGLAGICFPREYGGQGLTPAHQKVFNEEIAGYEYPAKIQVPTMVPCAAVILEFGSEEQKRQHLPAILKGEELWMQFLSEPSGGSDVAGALTTAVRDGDQWVLNGSKVWTTGAWWSDWGLCLARTNWDVPKHRGLTVFMLPIHQPGVEVHRIEMLNGSREFCQEFITDVVIPDADRVGDVDDGWTVGTRWMFHERMLFSSPYATHPSGVTHGRMDSRSVYNIARDTGRLDDAVMRDRIGEARMMELVADELGKHVNESIRAGRLSDQAAAIVRLFKGTATSRIVTLAHDAVGPGGAAWTGEGPGTEGTVNFMMRQGGTIGGGTLEMARNVIAERVLSMPRERALDRDIPFRDVPRSRPAHSSDNA